MQITRRQMIVQFGSSLYLAASAALATSPSQHHAPWQEYVWDRRQVFRQGSAPRAVLLLHEINGLSPRCVDFGQALFKAGFRVYMPLLFGHFGQDAVSLGFFESCVFGGFHCSALGKDLQSATAPIRWVQEFLSQLENDRTIDQIGVIGMCQSGAYPIAAMRKNSKVRAVVLSQPALPFGKTKQEDVGLPKNMMASAQESKIPMLAFRFAADTLCTACRFHFLEGYFGKEQFRSVTFDHCDCIQTMNHRCHAVLTGTTDSARETARRMVKEFFDEKLV